MDDSMFHIASVVRDDGAHDWYVRHRSVTGDTVEVKSSSGEVAVAYALLGIESIKRVKRNQDGAFAATRSPSRTPTLEPAEPSDVTSSHQALPTAGSINRVGTRMPKAALGRPMTCGQRMAQRRLELKLTQANVAARVIIEPKSGKHEGKPRQLSRNSYAMYELGDVEPSLNLIAQIARALSVEPTWLAFGTN